MLQFQNDGWRRRDDLRIEESDTKNAKKALMLPAWCAHEHLCLNDYWGEGEVMEGRALG